MIAMLRPRAQVEFSEGDRIAAVSTNDGKDIDTGHPEGCEVNRKPHQNGAQEDF